jgi:hypothetical protein
VMSPLFAPPTGEHTILDRPLHELLPGIVGGRHLAEELHGAGSQLGELRPPDVGTRLGRWRVAFPDIEFNPEVL